MGERTLRCSHSIHTDFQTNHLFFNPMPQLHHEVSESLRKSEILWIRWNVTPKARLDTGSSAKFMAATLPLSQQDVLKILVSQCLILHLFSLWISIFFFVDKIYFILLFSFYQGFEGERKHMSMTSLLCLTWSIQWAYRCWEWNQWMGLAQWSRG